ncbi:exodeoxyribonuclease VII large subunit [Tunicatimonas pelagia]|uniref:exodeoxyribonuclease VII large subunit n=1 Tax=Tunicatimonas pelagia TaxID=931531 RepID=UPI002666EF9C|nr:exodeoxyribonuclease VII large subunit [Tunicatimonas pelagia]WKN42709.1 exodeoxyribonuclease VII large subunit [Tunicatimonas pelagia]
MQYFSLYELNQKIKSALSAELEPKYWVVAEIGEMRVGQNGHCYLDLVEKNDNYLYAKTRATIWCNTYRGLGGWFESITGEALRPGLKILAQVEVSFHHLYGLSLNVKDIDAQFTLGERALKRQEVINQLVEDGVFDMNKGLTLTETPQKLAVISSPTAAGLGDFMDQLQENRFGYGFSVELFKAKMQGNEAAESIIQALHRIFGLHDQQKASSYDCVIIIRGGGAQVDLDCFDSYDLAAHVAQFPIPVITGIGHERDETVIDLIAHTRKKTPTAVAEFLIEQLYAFEVKLDEQMRVLMQLAESIIAEQNYRLEKLASTLKLSVTSHLLNQSHQLARLTDGLKSTSSTVLTRQLEYTSQLNERLERSTRKVMQEQYRDLESTEKLLQLLHPDAILQRGFSVTYIDGVPLQAVTQPEVGAKLITKTHRAVYLSNLEKVTQSENAEEEISRP